MTSFYKDLGYSNTPGLGKTNEAFEIVSSGLKAIREIKAFQGLDTVPILPNSRKSEDNTFSR